MATYTSCVLDRDITTEQKQLTRETDALLRDIAYVLKLTQRVRDEILCESEEPELATV